MFAHPERLTAALPLRLKLHRPLHGTARRDRRKVTRTAAQKLAARPDAQGRFESGLDSRPGTNAEEPRHSPGARAAQDARGFHRPRLHRAATQLGRGRSLF